MYFTRSNRIIVDEYDQMKNSGHKYAEFKASQQQRIMCEFCEQKIPIQLMKSHQNVCYFADKKQEYCLNQKKNTNKQTYPLQQSQKVRQISSMSNRKQNNSSARNRSGHYNSSVTKQASLKKTKEGNEKRIERVISNSKKKLKNQTRSKSGRKNQDNFNQTKLGVSSSFNMKKFLSKKSNIQNEVKCQKKNKKISPHVILDSKILRQSIDAKMLKNKNGSWLRQSGKSYDNKSKLKKKQMNKSLITEGSQQYYGVRNQHTIQHNRKQNKANKKIIQKPELNRKNIQSEYGDCQEIYYHQRNQQQRKKQQQKIKQIQLERERLKKQKDNLIRQIQREKQLEKRKKANEERIRKEQIKRERQRQRQRQMQRQRRQQQRKRQQERRRARQQQLRQTQNRRQSRNRPNRRRNDNRRRRRPESQNSSQSSYFEYTNQNGQNFNFISQTINNQFQFMKEQFNQMNHIFANFVPFTNNGFVFYQRDYDGVSDEYFNSDDQDNISSDDDYDGNLQEQEDIEQGLTQQQISMLNHFMYTKKLGSEDQCIVCINPLKHNQQIRQLPCAHMFHIQCIDTWLLKKTSCPVCRQDILKFL